MSFGLGQSMRSFHVKFVTILDEYSVYWLTFDIRTLDYEITEFVRKHPFEGYKALILTFAKIPLGQHRRNTHLPFVIELKEGLL
jgi:hypothetical protein